jgi:hypothetical protein
VIVVDMRYPLFLALRLFSFIIDRLFLVLVFRREIGTIFHLY